MSALTPNNGLGGYLRRRAAELGLERGEQLTAIQTQLNQLYPDQCRAASLNDGVLKITTPNASVASDLRLRQRELMRWFEANKMPVTRLIILAG